MDLVSPGGQYLCSDHGSPWMPAVPAGPWQRATLPQLWVWVQHGWCVRCGTAVWASGHRSLSWSLRLAAVQDPLLLKRPCQNMSAGTKWIKNCLKDEYDFCTVRKRGMLQHPSLISLSKSNLSEHFQYVWINNNNYNNNSKSYKQQHFWGAKHPEMRYNVNIFWQNPRWSTRSTLEFQMLLCVHFSIPQEITGKKNYEFSTNSSNGIRNKKLNSFDKVSQNEVRQIRWRLHKIWSRSSEKKKRCWQNVAENLIWCHKTEVIFKLLSTQAIQGCLAFKCWTNNLKVMTMNVLPS